MRYCNIRKFQHFCLPCEKGPAGNHEVTKTVAFESSRPYSGILLALALCACVHDARTATQTPEKQTTQVVMAVPPSVPLPVAAPAALARSINAVAQSFDGRVGVAIHSVDKGWTVESNGDLRLPQQSVSKLWVAMTVLDFRDRGRLTLDDPITLTEADLTLFHQPIAALLKNGGYQTTVGELLRRALTMSDNTCNDRLLRYVGGPSAVRDFIARKGLGNIRFGPGEKLLQSGTAGLTWKPEYSYGNSFAVARSRLPQAERVAAFERYVADPPDGAAPRAIARALARLKKGDLLSPASTALLIDTMKSSKTGKQRMRGAVPSGWSFGHKTGTGQDLAGRTAGYNDVGLLMAPDGRAYAIAVMIGDTPRTIPQRQQLMQSVVEAVVANS
jgi:beta-lactamase class A